MRYIGIALVYIAFFAMIAYTVYFTRSAWPLIALVCMPSFTEKS